MYPINFSNDPLYIETDKNIKSVKAAEASGAYNTWNNDRIKSAFNFGAGTVADFMQYAKNNARFINVFDLKTGQKIN